MLSLKVNHIYQLNDKTILEIELLSGIKMLKNDVFKNEDITFTLLSIGMMKKKIENIFTILVHFDQPVDPDAVVGKEFL